MPAEEAHTRACGVPVAAGCAVRHGFRRPLALRIQGFEGPAVPPDGLEWEMCAPSMAPRPRRGSWSGGSNVSPEPVRVLVLYSHPLMGEGLGRMLAAEPGIVVEAVDVAEQAAVDAALASEPAVIVLEEGGRVDAADVVRRSGTALVLDVDITTTSAWTLRRETLSSRPDDFLAAIRQAVSGASRPDQDRGRDLGVQSSAVSG
jgi:hypothetical protein